MTSRAWLALFAFRNTSNPYMVAIIPFKDSGMDCYAFIEIVAQGRRIGTHSLLIIMTIRNSLQIVNGINE